MLRSFDHLQAEYKILVFRTLLDYQRIRCSGSILSLLSCVICFFSYLGLKVLYGKILLLSILFYLRDECYVRYVMLGDNVCC
jgi:hypothetical protein